MGHLERAETDQLNGFFLSDSISNRIEDRFHGIFCTRPSDIITQCMLNFFTQFCLVHRYN